MSRRSTRAVLLWLGAVLVAVVTAALVATDLAALHRRAHSLGSTRPVAVATRDLPLGSTIDRGDVRARSVHRSQLPSGALSPGAAGGRVVGPFLKEMARLAHTEYLVEGHSTMDPRRILFETMFAPTVTGSPLESACRVISQHRSTQRKPARPRSDEKAPDGGHRSPALCCGVKAGR